ncbi:hypothetical protein ATCVNEJV2_1006R [Acanthocystis turfacea Chlorella virus NE-JV-2]|nr:hypothetical protein ATCVNEJV2_1006R [Acanthocystis turfacea Chlorella virus NE-JV-2]
MKTLEYHWADGTHTVFPGYTIDNLGVVRNKKGRAMTRVEDGEYYKVSIRHEGIQRKILVGRALASTFLGKPPTLQHTADHKDKNSLNDTLENIRWLCKPGQRKNQIRPTDYKSAFIIIKDGVELTAKEWAGVFKKPSGDKYTKKTIREYAQQQKHGFKYKDFQDIPGEEWKVVPDSKNNMGEWFISNMNRMKYKSPYAENVMSVDQLVKDKGYPVVGINGKATRCHELSMMTFRPEEYATKRLDFIILHENDDRLDFRPSKLRWGTPPENTMDAHNNGKFDGKKKARKPVASYINGEFEREHEGLHAAERYLKENGYPDANHFVVSYASENDVIRYDRTWKNFVK